MDNESIKRCLQRAFFMEWQIYYYTNLRQNFGSLVDQLYGLANENEADGVPIKGFLDYWTSLECVYADTHYNRNFNTSEEVPIICAAFINIIKLLGPYRELLLTKLTKEEIDEASDPVISKRDLPPIILPDTIKRLNLQLLIELELSIYLYSERRIPIESVLNNLQKVIRDLHTLPIEEFLNLMNGLRTTCEILDPNSSNYTFEQVATVCKYIVECSWLIEQYKETYLTDPYESIRYQSMLAWKLNDVDKPIEEIITPQIQENNLMIVESMVNRIENYGNIMFPSLASLSKDLEKMSASILPKPIKRLLDNFIRLEIIIEKAVFEKREYYTSDEVALIFGCLNGILKLLLSYKKM